jgi:hypothetical protein
MEDSCVHGMVCVERTLAKSFASWPEELMSAWMCVYVVLLLVL